MMDQYACYVWSTYGITLFILGINMALTFLEKYRIQKFLKNGSS